MTSGEDDRSGSDHSSSSRSIRVMSFGSVVGRDDWPCRHLVDDLVHLRLRPAPADPERVPWLRPP
jgi:hypothetical protein